MDNETASTELDVPGRGAPAQHGAGSDRPPPTIRSRLIWLALATVLPLLLLAGAAIWQQHRADRARAEEALLAQAHAVALLLDSEFETAEAVLRTLAESNALARDDLEVFWQEMRASAAAVNARAINLIHADGTILLSTVRNPGEARHAVRTGPAVQTLETGRRSVGDLYISPTVGDWSVGVAVPVMRQAGAGAAPRPAFVLGLVMTRDRLLAAVTRQRLPTGAVALVTDRARVVVAGAPNHGDRLGSPLRASIAGAMRGELGLVATGTDAADDPRLVTAYALAPESGYWVTIGVPEAVFEAPLRASLLQTALVGTTLLGLALLLASVFAGRLVAALRELSADGQQADIARPGSRLREVGDLADALALNARERERALTEMRRLFELSPVGVIRGDAGGRVHEANDAFLRMVGRTRTEVASGRLRWDELTPPEWMDRDEAAIAEAVQNGSCAPYQKEYLRRDGTRVPVLVFFAFDDVATGRIAAFVVDLSAWSVTDAALARAHEQMRLAIGAARMFFWDWNIATDEVEWSEGLEEACGLPPGGFGRTAKVFLSLLHPEDRPQVEASLGRALADEAPYEAEFRMRRADGSHRWVLARGTVLRDGSGTPVRMVGIDFDISDRKAAEKALAASTQALDRVRAAARVATFEVESPLDGGEALTSGGLQALHGLPQDAPCDFDTILARVHPDDRAAFVRQHESLVREGGRFMTEYRVVLPDATVRWLQASGEAEAGVAGRPARIQGVVMDVTDLKESETALRRTEAAARRTLDEIRAIYETAPIGLALVDRDRRFCNVNASLAEMNGVPAEAHLGRTVAEVVPDLWPQVEPSYRAVLDRGETVRDLPVSGLTPAGSPRHWLASWHPVRGNDDGVWAAALTVRDVTAERLAAVALRESEARFVALVDAMPQLAFIARTDGSNCFVNRRWSEYSGQTPEQAQGAGWASVLHPDDVARTLAVWGAATASGDPYEVEHRLLGVDGVHRWFLTRATPLRSDDGSVIRWFGTATDISEIVVARDAAANAARKLEARVEERTRALEDVARELTAEMRRREEAQAALLQSQKLEALGQLTTGVAHDFNNVLAAIQAGFKLLERRIGVDAEGAKLIRLGQHATERGTRLIAQLMAFARKEELQPRLTDVAGVLRGIEDLICHTAGAQVRCVLETRDGTWPVVVDPVRLETALLNLASNARDAMPHGGSLTVRVGNAGHEAIPAGLQAGPGYVLVSVSDTGCGMDAETLARATEPFFTTKPRGQGTGLGLASVQVLVAESGGRIRLLSKPGQGTVVEMFLPRAPAATSAR